jgi:RNA polymerase sigma-70 factor (ECF subfamily)
LIWPLKDHADDPSKHSGDDGSSVERLLAPLNPLQRSCVVLREIEELSYEEIAQMLKIKIGTVRSNLNRAKTLLRGMNG